MVRTFYKILFSLFIVILLSPVPSFACTEVKISDCESALFGIG
ncbi:MAG: hypothetical protein N2376_01910 [Clostridia bacterium]|nr:hypothetical protein [Clostridia bacterium]